MTYDVIKFNSIDGGRNAEGGNGNGGGNMEPRIALFFLAIIVKK
jgi:hypothetical protein